MLWGIKMKDNPGQRGRNRTETLRADREKMRKQQWMMLYLLLKWTLQTKAAPGERKKAGVIFLVLFFLSPSSSVYVCM